MAVQIEGVCALIQVYDMLELVDFIGAIWASRLRSRRRSSSIPIRILIGFFEARESRVHARPGPATLDQRPPARDPASVVGHRDTTLFFACPDIEGAYESLKSSGLSLQPPVVTHYGMRQLGFNNTDGYGICLQSARCTWPTFPTGK